MDDEAKSEAERVRRENRRPPSINLTQWERPALHEQHMVDLAAELGIPTEEHGAYTGLTYETIERIFREHYARTISLKVAQHQAVETAKAIGALRYWMAKNTAVPRIDAMTDIEVVYAARGILDTAKTVVTTCWAALTGMWNNMATPLRLAGILSENWSPTGDKKAPDTDTFRGRRARYTLGDQTLEDRVSERPK